MDNTIQESVRKKKKKATEKFIPPQFTTHDDINIFQSIPSDNIETQFLSTDVNKSNLSDEELKPVLSSSKKRRLRKKQAIEKKHLLSSKLSVNETSYIDSGTTIEIKDSIDVSIKVESVNAPKPDTIVDTNCIHHLANNINEDITSSISVTNTFKESDLVDRLQVSDKSSDLKTEDTIKESSEAVLCNTSEIDTMTQDKSESKSREEIKAEREAKKQAKQQKKKKLANEIQTDLIIDSKPERKQDSEKEEAASKTEQIAKGVSDLMIGDNESNKNVKSKSELKAERRAIQEAQRAAKEQASTTVDVKGNVGNICSSAKNSEVIKKIMPISTSEGLKNTIGAKIKEKPKIKMYQADHKVKLFQHLYAEREAAVCTPREPINSKDIHPAIIKLGVRYASGIVVGSNARCIAFLDTLKQVVRDFSVPAQAEFGRALEAKLVPGMAYLHRCRPLAVSMQNALKHFRYQLRQLPNDVLESEAKILLNDAIDTYIREQIEVAGQAISLAVRNKISDGDVILTYACSSLVEQILNDTWSLGVRFRVVVVGARPKQEATVMLHRLTAAGLPCTLVDISALSYIMKGVSKVLLGAGALLANGSVLGRAGTAAVALAASAYNVPTLVCCQTYKFSERVQADSFVYNEIGDPDELVKGGPLQGWRDSGVQPLQLLYDVTPPDLVAAVITELAIVPCTSVPVVLRFKLSEYGI